MVLSNVLVDPEKPFESNMSTFVNSFFIFLGFGFMVFNATFNNIAVISWRIIFLDNI
jgi:hypothetical protein